MTDNRRAEQELDVVLIRENQLMPDARDISGSGGNATDALVKSVANLDR